MMIDRDQQLPSENSRGKAPSLGVRLPRPPRPRGFRLDERFGQSRAAVSNVCDSSGIHIHLAAEGIDTTFCVLPLPSMMLVNVWRCEFHSFLPSKHPLISCVFQHTRRRRGVTCVYSPHSYPSGWAYRFVISAIYIGGIMFYKLGLEFFNGSITTLATDRFKSANAFTKCASCVV